MGFELDRFTVGDMLRCGAAVRDVAEGASSMEDAAGRVVRFFHEELTCAGEPASVLTRLYKTHPLGALEPGLRERAAADAPVLDTTPCLTLLATAGARREWNDRHSSQAHQVIPLPSADAVARSPMIAQLIGQLGIPIEAVVHIAPTPILDLHERVFNVFHVEDARGSEFIPAQDFVEQHGVSSVLGFGGLLAGSEMFAVIMFLRARLARETAEMFKTVALNVKLALLPFLRGPVFASERGAEATA